ncbi:hypothetical protein N5C39_24655 [Enterobacter bugandensis]|uniref:Uncharacterized protein n=1 Tax=Enterobacter bugandensis TaxID=881260 RepID=A0AA42PVH9_9ENTR|nr:hypothetical protein [Enterobacter bugandensis]MDH1321546.1 hypothetical protein [Enterobacter bugandensis]
MKTTDLANQKLVDGMITAKIENHDEIVIKGELIKITYEVTITNHSRINLKDKMVWFKLNNPIPNLPKKFNEKYKNDSLGDISIVSHAISGESGESRRFKGAISQFNKGDVKKVKIHVYFPVNEGNSLPLIESILLGDTPFHMGNIVSKEEEEKIAKENISKGVLLFEKKEDVKIFEKNDKKSMMLTTDLRLISQEPIYNEPTMIFGVYVHKNENVKVYGDNDRNRNLHGTYEQQYFHGMEFFDLKIKKITGDHGDIDEKITVELTLTSKALLDRYLTPEDGYNNFINDYRIHVHFFGVHVLLLN